MRAKVLFVAIALWLTAAQAWAVPLTVTNHGFEVLYFGGNLPEEFAGDVPPTAFPVGSAPSGWSAYGAVGSGASIGVLNPGVMT